MTTLLKLLTLYINTNRKNKRNSQTIYFNNSLFILLLIDAEDFLGVANDLLEKGRWSKVCFNAQQAAELALKALL